MNRKPLILELDIAGSPKRWINYEQAAYYYAKGLVAWTPTQDDFDVYGGTSRLTGTRSSMTMNTIIAVKGPVKVSTRNLVPALTNKALFTRDKHVCGYCGNEFKTSILTRDHIVPKSKGGPDEWTNVITSCKDCNHSKADRTPSQAKMELLYVPYEPSRAEYLILQNRRILADQMDFLMTQVPKHSRLLS